MTRDRFISVALISVAMLSSLCSCSRPMLSIRDLEALHSTVDGRLRHRYTKVDLYDDLDRLLERVPFLANFAGLVAPGSYELENPAPYCQDRLLELRSVDVDDPHELATVLYWVSFFARLDPSMLSREAAVRVLESLADRLPYRPHPPMDDLEAERVRRALVSTVNQLAADVLERRRVEVDGDGITSEIENRHVATIASLTDQRAPDLATARQILRALIDLSATPPWFLREVLRETVLAIGADTVVLVARSAFERTTEREREGFVQARVLRSYLALAGSVALKESVSWLGPEAEIAAVRVLVETVRESGFAMVVASDVVPWFLGLLDSPDDTVRLNVQAVLRDRSGRTFEDSAAAGAWWAEIAPGPNDSESS